MWESVVDLFWGGGAVWAASVCFCPRPKLAILADKPLAGRSVCLCPLSRGHREAQQRRGKKGPLKNVCVCVGGVKEKKLAWKKVCETPWDSRKRQWPLQCCWPQRFLCSMLLLAMRGSTLMFTQTGRKERPSAVYSTVASVSRGRGHWEHSPFWAFSVCQHASHSSGCQ